MKWFSFEVGHTAKPIWYHINLSNATYVKFTEKSIIFHFTQLKKLVIGTADVPPDIAVTEAELDELKRTCRPLMPN